ncbi:MAG: hypothetical protein RMJ54_14525, partial [Roseiflexaceae bacterium]|nr:hypothetical protein [Roseiflexaceae bacterium]
MAIEHGAKMVVVVCDTASAAALADLRRRFPDTPFVGIAPLVKLAAARAAAASAYWRRLQT